MQMFDGNLGTPVFVDKTSPFGRRTGPNELLPSGLLGPVTLSAFTRP